MIKAAAPVETWRLWRQAWREGIAPLLSAAALSALARALESDDAALIQGAVADPSPDLPGTDDWPIQGACAMTYGGWKAQGLATVAEAAEFFKQMCGDADAALFAAAGCSTTTFFLNWFDGTPRDEMRAALLPEVRRALDLRTLGECL